MLRKQNTVHIEVITVGLTENEFRKLIKGTYVKIKDKDLPSLPSAKTHLRYYVTYEDFDGKINRVFKKGGYLVKVTNSCVILGNVPDASFKRKMKKKGELVSDFDYFTWAVARNKKKYRVTWFRKYSVEELAEKYQRLKEKYEELKSRGRSRYRSSSVSSRTSDSSTISLITRKKNKNRVL